MFFLYDWIASVAGLFASNPLLLVFVLGIIGNVIPFVPTPSLLFIVVLVVTPGSGFQELESLKSPRLLPSALPLAN